MNGYTERLREILDTYEEELRIADRARKPASGLFGFGQGPGDDPCHSRMDQAVEALFGDMARDSAEASETGQVITSLLYAESEDRWPEHARLALLASQRHAIPLLSSLDRESRKELCAWYEKRHPRSRRFPLQKKIFLALKNG